MDVEIKALIDDGLPYKEIAAELGIKLSAVYHARKRLGLVSVRKKRSDSGKPKRNKV